jgi:hypothetical protein
LLSGVRKITQNGTLVHAAPIEHGQNIQDGPLVYAAPINKIKEEHLVHAQAAPIEQDQRMQEGPLVQQQQQRRTFNPPANSGIKKNVSKTKDKNAFAVQVLQSLHELKQSGRIWYKRFKAEMLALCFSNDDIAPCLFMKQTNKFVVIALYVDDINIFGTPNLTAQNIETFKHILK